MEDNTSTIEMLFEEQKIIQKQPLIWLKRS
jgi:hypothetical protein